MQGEVITMVMYSVGVNSEKEKDLHDGHRQRLREKYVRGGADNLETHELIEMLLYYCIPRRDTNEIAHEMLNHFGSLDRLLSAKIEELEQFDYVSHSGAILIKLIGEIERRRMLEMSSTYRYDSLDKVGEFLISLFRGHTEERLYLLAFDSGMKLINCSLISEGTINAVNVCANKIVELAVSLNASNIIIAHNHPGGVAVPSQNDISLTHSIESLTGLLHVRLLCHMIVAGDRYSPVSPCPGKFDFTV